MTYKPPVKGPLAPLKNVMLMHQMVQQLLDQNEYLPRIGVFYGFSGLGKTRASVHSTNTFDAAYVEVGSSWTAKSLVVAIQIELEITPEKTIAAGVEKINTVLDDDPRPLIIDEADHLVKRQSIEIIREIHDKGHVPVILIGEEQLPTKLEQWERVHGRVGCWQAAQYADFEDAKCLIPIYCPGVDIADDLLRQIIEKSKGSTRRICVNLAKLTDISRETGLKHIGLDEWSGHAFWTGKTPVRRVA